MPSVKLLPRFLALVSALLLPLALVAVWADQVVTDTSGYVDTVGPLASDPDVQEATAARVAAATNGLLRRQLGANAATSAGALTEEVALRVVESDSFEVTWRRANRAAHNQFEKVMRADRDAPVILDLSTAVDEVVDGVREAGVPLGEVDATSSLRIQLARSSSVERAQVAYETVDTFGVVTAIAWALLLTSALLLGRDRRAVIAFAAAATAVTTGLLWIGLWLGADAAASAVSATDRPLARAVYDVVTDDLELWTLVAFGTAVVVAVLNALLPGAKPQPAEV